MKHRPACLGVLLVGAASMVLVAGCAGPRAKDEPGRPAEPGAAMLEWLSAGPASEAHVAAVLAFLQSDDVVLRAAAAQALGAWAADCDPERVLPALLDPDPLVRGLAQAAYIETQAAGLGPAEIEGNVMEVPVAVLAAMAEMFEPEGLVDTDAAIAAHRSELRAVLDASPQRAVLAADVLARIGDEASRIALLELAKRDDGAVLARVARASVRPKMGLGAVLLPVIFKGDATARRGVVRALVVQPDPRMVDLLRKALEDEDPIVRRTAIRAMGGLGGNTPVNALADVVAAPPSENEKGEPDYSAQYAALTALGNAGTDKAVTVLRRTILRGTETADLEIHALFAVAPHATRADIPWAAKRLLSDNPMMRAAAAGVLGEIGNPAAQAALIRASDDPVPLVRATVVKALGQLQTLYAAKHLATMLDDPSPMVRTVVIWGLGHSRYEAAVPALAALAVTPVSPVDAPTCMDCLYERPEPAAVIALGRIGGPDAVAALIEVLGNPSWVNRAIAAEALALEGGRSDEVKAALKARLQDPSALVRARALVTLRSLGVTFPSGYFQAH